jgi:DnaJ homolog subfamily B member 13
MFSEKLRAIFDEYGEATLKLGAIDAQGQRTGGWTFTQSPDDVFNEFFGSNNPFSEYYKKGDKLGFETGFKPAPKENPTVVNLHCSYEELYSGCTKKVAVTKTVLAEDGKSTTVVEINKSLEISPGWKEGTKITFKNEGNQGIGTEPGNLIFVLKNLPHPHFERKGSNLIHTAKISLTEALTGSIVEVPTLDSKTISVTVEQVVCPGFTMRIPGKGMPKAKDPSKIGDLIIQFDVGYPKSLTEKQKKEIKATLGA